MENRPLGSGILAHIEFNFHENKIFECWQYFGSVVLPRTYTLFGLMGAVRKGQIMGGLKETEIFKARNFPEKVSSIIKEEYDESEGFSPSWLFRSELIEIADRYWEIESDWPELRMALEATIAAMDALGRRKTDKSRLVFWFS